MTVQITIRDVPEKVRNELAARAASQGKSMQEFLRAELERLAARPSIDMWLEQTRTRKQVARTRISAAQILKYVDAMNIIRRLERAKEIPTAEANVDVHALSQLEIELFPFEPFAGRVWELRHAVTC